MNVSELCRRLGTAEWRWELSDVTQVLGPIYREPVQKTARRITYRSPLGLDASVYHKDGRVFLIEDTFQVLLDQDAIWLAQWSAPNARLLVELKHEDKELPLRLGVIVVPPEGQA